MRIVVDANVLLSGIFWSGVPGQLLHHEIFGRVELIASVEIVAEYERVLSEVAGVRGREMTRPLPSEAGPTPHAATLTIRSFARCHARQGSRNGHPLQAKLWSLG